MITKIIEVEGLVGQNVHSVLAECRELAQLEHCIVKVKANGKTVMVDEHRPFWMIVRDYESLPCKA
jgi:hypothetical protein